MRERRSFIANVFMKGRNKNFLDNGTTEVRKDASTCSKCHSLPFSFTTNQVFINVILLHNDKIARFY